MGSNPTLAAARVLRMTESSPAQPPAQRFTLNAPPPVRPLAIAAGTVVVAAVLLVLWHALSLPVAVGGLAGLLLVLGVALLVTALVMTARLRTEVRLDADGIRVSRKGHQRSVSWSEVKEVGLAPPRLTLATAERGSGVVVVNPRRPDDPVFAALVEQVRERLDRNRGYSDLTG